MNENQRKLKQLLAVAVPVLLLLSGFYWFATHGTVEVVFKDGESENAAVELLDQRSQKSAELKTSGGRAGKLLRSGSYEVLVRQAGKSYFAVAKAGGFLRKTVVTAEPVAEKQRQFVGNNPSPCMTYVNGVLLTHGCYESATNLQVHVPANEQRPTYVQKTPNKTLTGRIEGTAATAEGAIIMIRSPKVSEDQGFPHTIYTLGQNGDLSQGRPLKELSRDKLYSLIPHKEGFVVHDDNFEQVLYYSSSRAQPAAVEPAKPEGKDMRLYALSLEGDLVAAAYSNNAEGEVADIHDIDNDKARTEVTVRQGDSVKRFKFKGHHAEVRLCGNNRLCLLSKPVLSVYDIGGNKQKLVGAVGAAEKITTVKGSTVVIRKNDVIGLDTADLKGSRHYTLDGYGYCGLHTAVDSYTLCLINSRQKKVALRLIPDADNTDGIDKKIAELLKLAEIKDISIYDRFITVSPELGKPVYDPATRGFTYDPNTRNTVNTKINQEIARLGIDRTHYRIRNPFE